MIDQDAYCNNIRFHQLVSAVVHQTVEGFTEVGGCDVELICHVAREAAVAMLKMIYEQDRELAALKHEVEVYRNYALNRIMVDPTQIAIQTIDRVNK